MHTLDLDRSARLHEPATPHRGADLRRLLAAAALVLAWIPAEAGTIPLFVDQFASTHYGTGNNAEGTFGDTDIVAMSYFLGSGAGTTNVRHTSSFALDYPDRVQPNQPFALWFRGWQAGSLTTSSTFAAGAGVTLLVAGETFSLLDKAAVIVNADSTAPFTVRGWRDPDLPEFPFTRSGSDCVDIDIVDLLLVSGGGSFCVEQQMRWNVTTGRGRVRAQLGAYDLYFPFLWDATVSDGAGNYYDSVYLSLPEYGAWTISIPEFEMVGWTESHVDVDLCAQIDVVGFDPYRFGCGAVSAYDTARTELDFPLVSLGSSFRIQVPEPATPALLGLGLAALATSRRRRQ